MGTAILDGVQTGLDVVGLVPGFGEIADGVNALIYTGRGDYVNAGLSAAAMIPFAGWAATDGKFANKAVKYHNRVDASNSMFLDGMMLLDISLFGMAVKLDMETILIRHTVYIYGFLINFGT